jgi:hypothetical protein
MVWYRIGYNLSERNRKNRETTKFITTTTTTTTTTTKMSRSTKGTRKTTSHIDTDSSKYVQRTSLGHTKRGEAGSTDAAHIFSFGLANAIMTNTGGRPMSDDTRREFIRDMNDSTNMRIKSSYGNKVLDERRDARIAQAFVNDEAIRGNSTASRAYQAYQSANSFTTTDSIAKRLGEMRVYNPETGRSHKLKNHHNF